MSSYDGRYQVSEPPSAGGTCGPQLLYEVDLTVQGNQDLTADGLFVVDGMNWYAKGDLVTGGATYTRNLVSGSGLSIKHIAGAAGTAIGAGAALAFPHFFFPLSQITGWNLLEPMLLRARFGYDALGDPDALFGLCNSTNDGVNLSAADRQYDFFQGPQRNAAATAATSFKVGTNGLNTGSAPFSVVNNQFVTGVFSGVLNTLWNEFTGESLAAGMPPAISSISITRGTSTVPGDTLFPSRSNPGLFFGCNSSSGGMFGVYLRAIQIFAVCAS